MKLICKTCQEEKPTSEFNKNQANPTGYHWHCRECTQKKQREEYREQAKKGRVKVTPNEKVCTVCKESLPASAFRNYRWSSTGLTSACKKCMSIKKIIAKYNISDTTYLSLLKKQDNKCAICGQPPGKRELSVDHNHQTGEVRGLLCDNCNLGLGNFQDSPFLLNKAISYVQK